jgi:hypothetical protein
MNHLRERTIFASILAAAALRLLPHPWNVTPIGAMALFGGATLGARPLAFAAPLAALFLSDLFIGFHKLMPAVYLAFALVVALGALIRRRRTPGRVVAAMLAGSVVFFLVTNFAVWAFGSWYPKSPAGLAACYLAGLPFLRNTMAGDLFYAAVLFGGLALAERQFPALREAGAGRTMRK